MNNLNNNQPKLNEDTDNLQDSSFILKIKTSINKLYENNYLKDHQLKAREFFKSFDTRGLYVYHKMGTGKSILSISIAEYFHEIDPERKIIILAAKGLHSNYKKNIKKYYNAINKEIDENSFTFVSSNSSNMIKKISEINSDISKKNNTQQFSSLESKLKKLISDKSLKPKETKELKKTKDDIIQDEKDLVKQMMKNNPFENTLLIVDEFHNLSNSITNGSKNAVKFYQLIMSAKNIKLVFLTGTPIVNRPFELCAGFNMLRGYLTAYQGLKKTPVYRTLFPDNEDVFNMYFVNSKSNHIKNKPIFKNRIVGMVSYEPGSEENFPEKKDNVVEEIEMSGLQYKHYMIARGKEKLETAKKRKGESKKFAYSINESFSTYRIKSRQACNYIKEEKTKLTSLDDLKIYSPKYTKLINNIKSHDPGLICIYTEFVTGVGIESLNRIFQTIMKWTYVNDFFDNDDGIEVNKKDFGINNIKFAIISGKVSHEKRQNILEVFNEKDNRYGKYINILIISKTGAEGLDLKSVKYVHILEPFWNYERINQIIYRAVRLNSHEYLEKNEREVQAFIYLSTVPQSEKKDIIDSADLVSTDEHLYYHSINQKKLNDEFLECLHDASIDRNNVCSDPDIKLYHTSIADDIKNPVLCSNFAKDKIDGFEIYIKKLNEYYFYTLDQHNEIEHIYKHNLKYNKYIIVDETNELYDLIIRSIESSLKK